MEPNTHTLRESTFYHPASLSSLCFHTLVEEIKKESPRIRSLPIDIINQMTQHLAKHRELAEQPSLLSRAIQFLSPSNLKLEESAAACIDKTFDPKVPFRRLTSLKVSDHRLQLATLSNILNSCPQLHTLQLLGLSLDGAAGTLLGAHLRTNRTLTVLDLSRAHTTNDIGGGADAIFDSLGSNTTLRTLRVGDNMIRDLTKLVSNLRINSTLSELDVTSSECNGADIIDALAVNRGLRTVNLTHVGLGHISSLTFFQMLSLNTTLSTLLIGNVRRGMRDDSRHPGEGQLSQIGLGLGVNQAVSSLTLTWADFEHANPDHFEQALRVNTSLTALDLSMVTGLTQQSIDAIISGLSQNKTLQELNLDCCDIYDNNGAKLVLALMKSPLVKLVMSSTKIGPDTGCAFKRLLEESQTLEILKLDFNLLEAQGVKAIASGMCFNKTVTYLNLSSQTWASQSTDELWEQAFSQVAEMIEKNTTLETFKMCNNDVRKFPNSFKKICEALKKNTTLKTLDVGFTSLTENEVKSLEECVAINTGLQVLITHQSSDNFQIEQACARRIPQAAKNNPKSALKSMKGGKDPHAPCALL
jgi:hypothetical protein